MSLERLTAELIANDDWRMQCLAAARELRLDDWFVAAGFVRNLIWDHLHRYEQRTPLNDVDVVFLDRADVSAKAENVLEERLRRAHPEINWQVRNQARMHLRNGHYPYADTSDAIGHFPEMATCTGVRLNARGEIGICAPYGLEQNWALKLSANRRAGYPGSLFNHRVRQKQWLDRWPRLDVAWESED